MSDSSQTPQSSKETGSATVDDASQTPQKGSKKLVLKITSLSLVSFIALSLVAYLSFNNYQNHGSLLRAQLELVQKITTVDDTIGFIDDLRSALSLENTKGFLKVSTLC